MNIEKHRIYSDNLELCVLDLTQIKLATQEDKEFQIDYWAALFKSKTWEEMKMLAKKNEYMEEATKTVFRMSAEEEVIKRCRDREDYYSDLRSYEKEIAKKDAEIVALTEEKVKKDIENEILKKHIEELEAKLKAKSS